MKDISVNILFCCSLAFSVIAIFSPLSTIPASLFLVASFGVFYFNGRKQDHSASLEARVVNLEKRTSFMKQG
jgi:hypothetical protein